MKRAGIRIDVTAASDFLAWLFVRHDKRKSVDPVDGTIIVEAQPSKTRKERRARGLS